MSNDNIHQINKESIESEAKQLCLRIADDLKNEKISLEEAAQIAYKLVKNQGNE